MRPIALLLSPLIACGPTAPYAVILEQGADRYFDQAEIAEETKQGIDRTVTFTDEGRARCLRGAPFRVSTRDTGSDELMIFLAGGGACWKDRCTAIEEANMGIYPMGVLHQQSDTNPLAAWSVLYVPYCDGSLFAGDVDIDDDGDGEIDRYHRGLANLSAALDEGKRTFPSPKKILLAGSSGGGFGTLVAAVVVRLRYPGVPIVVMNDSGIGIAKDGEPEFIRGLLEEWGAFDLMPPDQDEMLSNGHLTGFIEWQLAEDPDLKIGAFSYLRDTIVSEVFLDIEPQVFCEAAQRETARIHRAFPERYRYFLASGDAHTVLYAPTGLQVSGSIFGEDAAVARGVNLGGYDSAVVGGQSVGEWMMAMVEGRPEWLNRPQP